MTATYKLTYSEDDLQIANQTTGDSLDVKKRGAHGTLGQLFSRRFVIFDPEGTELFQVVDGNSGTYPRAALVVDGKESFVLTAGGRMFITTCSVRGNSATIEGDPFSSEFTVTPEGSDAVAVNARRGSGKTEYDFTVADSCAALLLAIVATIAVFRGRIVPAVEA